MSVSYFKIVESINRLLAMLVIVSILTTAVPASVFADDVPPPDTPLQNTVENQTASTTPETATTTPDGGNATSTESGSEGGDGNATDGNNGEGNTNNGTTTATSTPNEGTGGSEGSEGAEGTAGATPNDEVNPVDIVSDGLLGDQDAPEEEETTGDIRLTGTNALIETGTATAQGELSTDANSNDIRSELGGVMPNDFDTYTFTANGTNNAVVSNDALARSASGDNYARGRSTAKVNSGDSIAAFNIANVINTNVVNSDGFIYLANKILDVGQSLDLTSAFFPDVAQERELSEACSLLSCTSEDVVYNSSQMNHATITNNALVESISGYNTAIGDLSAEVTTGDAYAAANVINVVNSNIIDSNYRLFTYNAIGDLDGDLVLPSGELFDAFFGRANGIAADENDRRGKYEDFNVNANNINDAVIDNNLDTYAETGLNESTTDFDSIITTGRGESESNVLSKVNENTYGGDSMYMLIRVHGEWSGDVVGLPEGLSWEWTPMGIVIYNTDAEIAPSAFLSGYDLDSYTANFNNNNRVALENNITVNAVTGENTIDGLVGSIKTGDAFASANVMNIANTNIIGTNWTFAVINILGDFDGNVSFEATDIALAGTVTPGDNPLGPNDALTYNYTVTNNSDKTATNVVLEQVLQSALTNTNQTTQSRALGTIAPGASKAVVLNAKVLSSIPYGTTPVVAYATISSDQGDSDVSDNNLMLSINALNPQPTGGGTGTTTGTTTNPGTGGGGSGGGGGGTGTTTNPGTGGGTGTTTNPGTGGTGTSTNNGNTTSGNVSSGGGGGGGGGGSSSNGRVLGKSVEKVKKAIDPKKAPLLSIKKTADHKNQVVSAGDEVTYEVVVTNLGGLAYNGKVYDKLVNPIGSVVSEQSWDLGTIGAGEIITLDYTIKYEADTPSGIYTNTAELVAYRKASSTNTALKVKPAVHKLEISGKALAIGNVGMIAYAKMPNGKYAGLIGWETTKPTDGQVFFDPKGAVSPYNETALNYGFKNASNKLNRLSVRHYRLLTNLDPGLVYNYRVSALATDAKTIGGDYIFTVPGIPGTIATPVVKPKPVVSGAAIKNTVTTPTPATAPAPAATGVVGGFVNQVKNSFTNFWR